MFKAKNLSGTPRMVPFYFYVVFVLECLSTVSTYTYKDAPRSKGTMGRRDGPTRKYPASQFPKKGRYFICDSNRHFMAQCPERHCAKYGERGHEVRYCLHTRGRRGVFQATTQHSVVHETAVVVPVKWNGKPINVMMDTGADPSVVDRGTVQKMNIPYSTKYSQVYGLGRTALAVCGTACVAMDVGDGRPLEHEIEILDTNNRVVILGRRFLARFKNITFDWENMRVRLGGCWKTSLAAARGDTRRLEQKLCRLRWERREIAWRPGSI